MKLNILTLVIGTFALAVFLHHAFQLGWTPMRILGMVIAIAGFVLLLIARLQLGRAFSIEAKATTLVTTGLYSRIRNPVYVFSGLTLAGLILWTGRPWFFLLFVLLIPLQVFRSRQEAQVLADKFGDAYLAYRRRTWF
ncbi:MAG: methyltransferase family protein [Acidobacteriota bacterium]